jgi:hypothetical protein
MYSSVSSCQTWEADWLHMYSPILYIGKILRQCVFFPNTVTK